ncbi:MAG: PEGA domain-containing protein, partial [Methanosarcinaceae archaeon]|nr:PEGA domain-containing protein [Methanosarcinaceae archaeon]
MEIKTISSSKIEMENEDSISLSKGDTIDIMGEIKIKVADDSEVRYYPFVEITKEPTESLDIDMPKIVNEDETFTITVTSRGAAVSDVSVEFDGDSIGTTSRDGIVTYEPKEAGKFKVSVEKEGYISASEQIEVISPDDETKKMSIEISPDEVYEGEMITISTVKSIGGEAIEDAEILYDNNPIGTTSEDGTLSYTTKEVGMHKITATKDGFIDSAFDLEVLAIEADFEFSNLVVSPLEVKAGKDVTITVDVLNDGKAEGEYNVELFINGNVTDSQQISLGVGESITLEFAHSEDEPGTYEASIQELSGTFEVLEKGSSALLYVLGILGVLVVIAAGYMFTAGGWTVEMVSEKISEFIKSIR